MAFVRRLAVVSCAALLLIGCVPRPGINYAISPAVSEIRQNPDGSTSGYIGGGPTQPTASPSIRASSAPDLTYQQQSLDAQLMALEAQHEIARQNLATQQLIGAAALLGAGSASRLPAGAYTLPNNTTNCTYGGGYMQCH